jgi:PHD/YefM family antitoxin component YafN of YafNO toxin-antitoxin module
MIKMKQETVTILKKEYDELLEEVGLLRNKEMMESVKESDEAEKKGVKTWKLKVS